MANLLVGSLTTLSETRCPRIGPDAHQSCGIPADTCLQPERPRDGWTRTVSPTGASRPHGGGRRLSSPSWLATSATSLKRLRETPHLVVRRRAVCAVEEPSPGRVEARPKEEACVCKASSQAL